MVQRLLKAADLNKPEPSSQNTAEKQPVTKGGKKAVQEAASAVVENTDFSLPSKWENYTWPSAVKIQLCSNNQDSISKANLLKPIEFINDLLLGVKILWKASNKLQECLPFLHLAEIISETMLSENLFIKNAIALYHSCILKSFSTPYESKLQLTISYLYDNFESGVVALLNEQGSNDINELLEIYIIAADCLESLGDFSRSCQILLQISQIHSGNSMEDYVSKCYVRLARQKLNGGNQKQALMYSQKGNEISKKNSMEYYNCFVLMCQISGQEPNAINDTIQKALTELEICNQSIFIKILKLRWLSALLEMGIQHGFEIPILQDALMKMKAISMDLASFDLWENSILKYLEYLLKREYHQDWADFIEKLEIPTLGDDHGSHAQIEQLILLLKAVCLVEDLLYEKPVSVITIDPVTKYLNELDGKSPLTDMERQDHLKALGVLQTIDVGNKGWVSLFVSGMFNFFSWKKTSLDGNSTSKI